MNNRKCKSIGISQDTGLRSISINNVNADSLEESGILTRFGDYVDAISER